MRGYMVLCAVLAAFGRSFNRHHLPCQRGYGRHRFRRAPNKRAGVSKGAGAGAGAGAGTGVGTGAGAAQERQTTIRSGVHHAVVEHGLAGSTGLDGRLGTRCAVIWASGGARARARALLKLNLSFQCHEGL